MSTPARQPYAFSATFVPEPARRAALAMATTDLDLSDAERRILDWLAGWDQDTVGPIITMLHKARRGTLEPPMPAWVERYGR